tara:strand:+ start:42 stop:500 length:459 start_codon:yes stop_codon:yes gene_type:complete
MASNEIDLFKDYGLLDSASDLNLMTLFSNPHDAALHSMFPDNIARNLKSNYPELGDTRIDRGLLDMAINFAGGYDWAARDGVSKDAAKGMARHYQNRGYDDRPEDSINDYYENEAGINLVDKSQPRLSNSDLMELAVQYAKDRYSRQSQAGK